MAMVEQNLQPTIADETTKSCVGTECEQTQIENNSGVHVVSIAACGKCQSDSSSPSDGATLSANININISNNYGIIIIGHQGQFHLDVKPTDTIEEVKSKIHGIQGIPTDHQQLYFSGRQLENSRTLSNYDIENGSTVKLVMRQRGGMCIFVKSFDGKTLSIHLNSESSVKELKEKIQEIFDGHEDLHPTRQRLIYGSKQLDDGRTLADYNITDASFIDLVLRLRGGEELRVIVKTSSGETFSISNVDTIREIKLEIEMESGIPANRQQLVFDGRILEDREKLSHYNIENKSVLTCNIKSRNTNSCIIL